MAQGLAGKIKLPAGYAVYARENEWHRVDRYIYGHPSQQAFKSANEFSIHFKYLMWGDQSEECKCRLCRLMREKQAAEAERQRAERRAERRAEAERQEAERQEAETETQRAERRAKKQAERQEIETLRQEAETERQGAERQGAEDRGAEEQGQLVDQDIAASETDERPAMDRGVQSSLPSEVPKVIGLHHLYRPRLGEIVLFSPSVEGEIVQESSDRGFKLRDRVTNEFIGRPKWMGGTVMQVEQPKHSETTLQDSGFQIKCYYFPDKDAPEKDYEETYFVPIHHIRPLVFWKELHATSLYESLHETVKSSLTTMKTFNADPSLENRHFQGKRPPGYIPVKQSFFGPEVIYIGDFVRLQPCVKEPVTDIKEPVTDIKEPVTDIKVPVTDIKEPVTDIKEPVTDILKVPVTDILEVTNIIVQIPDLQSSDNENATKLIFYEGRTYTTEKLRSSGAPVDRPAAAMQGYGPWFPWHPRAVCVKPLSIVGRLHEAEAVQELFPCFQDKLLDLGREGVVRGRNLVDEYNANK